MTTQEIREQKTSLRACFKAKRQELDEKQRAASSKSVSERIINSVSFEFADSILMYYPCHGEVDVLAVFAEAKRQGKIAAFPRSYNGGVMHFFVVNDLSELEKGRYGLMEPKECLPELEASKHPLCIVPALAFDKDGFRLGYGGGYYDRFLSKFDGISAGVQYDDLLIDALPREKRRDRNVDIVVTEKRMIVIGQEKQIR